MATPVELLRSGRLGGSKTSPRPARRATPAADPHCLWDIEFDRPEEKPQRGTSVEIWRFVRQWWATDARATKH